MRKNLIVLSILVLSGCQTTQQRQSDEMRARAEAMRVDSARVTSFCENLFTGQEIDPIRAKIGIVSGGEDTFEMLTDNTKPTMKEKKALVFFAKKKEECHKETVASMRRFSPYLASQYITLEEAAFPRFQFLIADLHNDLITYGEFSKKRKELTSERKVKKEEIRDLLAQRSADANYKAAQLANDVRKATALEEQAANQRNLNYLRQAETLRPRTPITCSTYYNMTTCQ